MSFIAFFVVTFAILAYFAYFMAMFFSDIHAVYFIAVMLSLFLYLIISAISVIHNNGSDDYYAAGHAVPGFVVGCCMAAAFHSSGMFLGDAAFAYRGFLSIALVSLIQSGGYFIGNAYLGRYLHRTHVTTMPEYAAKRFCSKNVGRAWAVMVVIMLSIYTVSVMTGIGTFMSYISGISYKTCLSIALFTIMLCVLLSGNRGVAFTGTAMVILTVAGLVFGAFAIANTLGGWNFVIAKLAGSQYHDFISWTGVSGLYGSVAKNYYWGFSYAVLYACVAACAPWQIRGYLLAQDEHEMSIGAFVAAVVVFITTLFALITALFVLVSPLEVPSPVYAVMTTPGHLMPIWAGILLTVGIVSAGMSSSAVFISMIGTYIANDIIDKKDENGELDTSVGRLAVIIMCVLIWLVLLNKNFTVFGAMTNAASLGAACCVPATFASVWSKRVTKQGVLAGGIAAFIIVMGLNTLYHILDIRPYIWLIPFTTGTAANILIMAIVSHFTEATQEEEEFRQSMFIMPEDEKTEHGKDISLSFSRLAIWLGPCATILLIVLWAWPVFKATH